MIASVGQWRHAGQLLMAFGVNYARLACKLAADVGMAVAAAGRQLCPCTQQVKGDEALVVTAFQAVIAIT